METSLLLLGEKDLRSRLDLHIGSEIFTVDGAWHFHDQRTGTIADLQQGQLSFNYLININEVNHLVHPDDIPGLKVTLQKLQKGQVVDYTLRVITPKGEIRVLQGEGKLTMVNNTPIADWDETTSRQELELKIFQHGEEVSDSGTWTWNLQTDEFYCTRNFCRILHLPEDLSLVDFGAFAQLVHFDDRERMMKLILEMKKDRREVDVSFRIFLPEGQICFLRTKGEVFTTRTGVQYFIGTTQDITRERLAEDRLKALLDRTSEEQSPEKELREGRRSNVRNVFDSIELNRRIEELERALHKETQEREKSRMLLEDILNALPQMVWLMEPDGKIWFVNDKWYSYTGMDKEQCMDMNARRCAIFHPGQSKEVEEKWKAMFLDESEYSGEFLLRNAAGEYRWHLDITVPVRNEKGNVELFVGSFTDLHKQIANEREIVEVRDLLEGVLNASINGVAVFDGVLNDKGEVVDFRCEFHNDRASVFYDRRKLVGQTLSEILRVRKATQLFDVFRQVALSGEPVEFDFASGAAEDKKWYHVFAAKLEDGLVITQYDVTEQMLSRERLQRMNESLKSKNNELRDLNEELTNFAFIASHDLREPLRKIQIFGSELQLKENLSERGVLYMGKIISAVTRMNDLIEDILNYSKASSGRTGKRDWVDLNEVLKQVLSELEEPIRKSNAQIHSSHLPSFLCDARQIMQLMTNLLSNAIKFQSAEREPVIKMQALVVTGDTIDSPAADPATNYLKLEVSDNGIGFEEELMDKVFGMFQRLHARGHFPGTGMGLAICKRIVENHKGIILARSTVGEGSVFTCFLPVLENV